MKRNPATGFDSGKTEEKNNANLLRCIHFVPNLAAFVVMMIRIILL